MAGPLDMQRLAVPSNLSWVWAGHARPTWWTENRCYSTGEQYVHSHQPSSVLPTCQTTIACASVCRCSAMAAAWGSLLDSRFHTGLLARLRMVRDIFTSSLVSQSVSAAYACRIQGSDVRVELHDVLFEGVVHFIRPQAVGSLQERFGVLSSGDGQSSRLIEIAVLLRRLP
ncbi:hypothetical protein BV20DRAFT_741603 [Pilatotrama ljubarskyi]|nr:hypothetical protein BV20DRAFT_741603 [Pilatotrama ljubarskyi]